MRVVGLDLSVRSTGIARADGTTLTVGSLGQTGYHRHAMICAQILDMLRSETVSGGPVDVVVIEDYFIHASQPRAVIVLAELGGLIRTTLDLRGYAWTTVAPAELKKWATGRGNATKSEMIRAALDRGARRGHQTVAITDDEADAFLCRAWGLEHLPKETTDR